jgi:hypothetical protein
MLEISGKIIQILPIQSGTGKNGNWQKQDFVLETQEQYPKKVCFSAWADKADLVKNTTIGSSVKVAFNAESREFNGKWYTELRIWKLEISGSSGTDHPGDEYYKNLTPPPQDNSLEPSPDDLPF